MRRSRSISSRMPATSFWRSCCGSALARSNSERSSDSRADSAIGRACGAEAVLQPGTGKAPIAFDGRQRGREGLCDLGHAEAAEKAQFHDLGRTDVLAL